MLICAKDIGELDFDALMEIYKEGNIENGEYFFPDETPEQQYILACQSFRKYLVDDFFKQKDAQYWILADGGRYVSALRLVAFEDGVLLEALETHPDHRRKGLAKQLICEVMQELPPKTKIYSHVAKWNAASLATHRSCGFSKSLNYVVESDGTVCENEVTLTYIT